MPETAATVMLRVIAGLRTTKKENPTEPDHFVFDLAIHHTNPFPPRVHRGDIA